jgi:ferredoxin
MRVTANRDVCIGAGQCVLTEPAVFDQDDDGTVLVRLDRPTGETADRVREAVGLCPSGALRLDEDRTRERADGRERPDDRGRERPDGRTRERSDD